MEQDCRIPAAVIDRVDRGQLTNPVLRLMLAERAAGDEPGETFSANFTSEGRGFNNFVS